MLSDHLRRAFLQLIQISIFLREFLIQRLILLPSLDRLPRQIDLRKPILLVLILSDRLLLGGADLLLLF